MRGLSRNETGRLPVSAQLAHSRGDCWLSFGYLSVCFQRRWLPPRSLLAVLWFPAVLSLFTQFTPQQVIAADEVSGITQEQAEVILQELKSIRELLEQMNRQPAQPASAVTDRARISIKDRPALGEQDAPVTVVEFTDYECPFCKRFHQTTFNSLTRDYIDTGKVRWVVLDLPLPMHPNAGKAAQAAHCADEQQSFWKMRKMLFDNAPASEPESLAGYAQQLDLDQQAFDDCLTSDRYLAQIDADSGTAAGMRITGTPTFIIGRSDAEWIEGRKIIGAQSYAVFDSAIRLLLSENSTEND